MFVYQNKDGNICVTFKDNKPVESPEYIIAIDEDAQALYSLAGEIGAPTADDSTDEGGKDDEEGSNDAGGTDTPKDDGDDTVTETTDTGAVTGDSATETEIE